MKLITRILTIVAVVALSANVYASDETITDQLVMPGSTSGLLIHKAAAVTTSWDATWPATAGTSTYVLTTDGAGVFSWAAPGLSSALTTNNIFVGVGGVATDVPMSLDATIAASGAVTISAGAIDNGKVDASAAIDYSKLAALTDGSFLVGNGSAVATVVAPSGDVTFDNTGAFSYTALSIVNADVSASAAIDYSKLATLTSGNILVGSAGNAATSVAMSGDMTMANTGAISFNGAVIVNADVNASAAIAHSKMAALTANEAMVTDGSGFATTATGVSATEVGYLNGVTSAIQTQIDAIAGGSSWTKTNKTFSDFGTEEITLIAMSAGDTIESVIIDVTTLFSGGDCVGDTLEVGVTSDTDKYTTAFTADSAGRKHAIVLDSFTGATNITLTGDCATSGTFDTTIAGVVDVYTKSSSLP